MKDDLRCGLAAAFWNADQRRLRAPFRVTVSALLVLVFVLVLGFVAFVLWAAVGEFGSLLTVVAEIFSILALIGAVLSVSWVVDRRTFHDVGLARDTEWRRGFAVGLAVGAAMVGVVVAVVLATGGRVAGTALTRDGALFSDLSFPVGLFAAAVYFLAVGVLEELVFRGYLLVNVAEGVSIVLDDRRAVVLAGAATAGLFGLLHAGNPAASATSTLVITLFGLLLASAYVLTDSLALPIGIHTGWNVVLGPVFGLPVSGLTTSVALVAVEPGNFALAGGAFGPEGGAVALVGLLIGTGLLAGWLRWRGELSIHKHIAEPDLWSRSSR